MAKNSKPLHWGDDDITTWDEDTLRWMFETFRQDGTWQNFMPEIEAMQAEFARRGIR